MIIRLLETTGGFGQSFGFVVILPLGSRFGGSCSSVIKFFYKKNKNKKNEVYQKILILQVFFFF